MHQGLRFRLIDRRTPLGVGQSSRALRCGSIMLAVLLCLGGCAESAAPAPDVVRSVKTIVIDESAGAQQRQIAGVLAATQVADLSFAVRGTVQQVLVDEGMSVSAGQVLARLDTRTYELALSAAQARLASARATLEERRLNFERQQTLFARQLVARAAFDRASADLDTSRAQVAAAESDVDRARRDIERTALVAPYDGIIAARDVEPFQEVTEGAVVLTLEGGAGIQVDVLVPESLIREVAYGDPVRVRLPTLADIELPGTVTEIGSRTEAGNAFPVRVRIDSASAAPGVELRPGLSARVVFELARNEQRKAVLVPLSAIAFGQGEPGLDQDAPDADGPRQAPVFVFDPGSSTVRKVIVRAGDIRGNLVEVYEGLAPGDRVVVAGVAFLRDGMPARLWTPDL